MYNLHRDVSRGLSQEDRLYGDVSHLIRLSEEGV